MSERGMGSAVGQVPEYSRMITEWVKEVARTPVLVKLTPNITDIRAVARAPSAAAPTDSPPSTPSTPSPASISTRFTPRPNVGGYSAHGGYCGPAVKPIALHLVQQIATDPEVGIPISGIGGVSGWREAAEFIPAGLRHRAGLHRRHALRLPHRGRHDRRPEPLDGRKRLRAPSKISAAPACPSSPNGSISISTIRSWRASIATLASAATFATSPAGTARTSASTWMATPSRPPSKPPARRASRPPPLPNWTRSRPRTASLLPHRIPRVDEEECVGCNLCWLVCPVENCITMEQIETGKPFQSWEMRSTQGQP
jgi:dihydropyrimidine dehydrogenase (NAD+) subunit PreA